MQLKSWFKIEGSKIYPAAPKGVIASFYFPINSSGLDTGDLRVLSQCVGHLRRVLKRERVELSIIGHTDHRGIPKKNKALGYRRAQSVASEFNRHLRSEQNFSSFSGLSRGENYSVQGTRDQQVLAQDRRVDVWSTTAEQQAIPQLPKLDLKPGLMRPVSRVFRKVQVISNVEPPLDDVTQGLVIGRDLFLDWIRGGQNEVPGDEHVKKRSYKFTDATHRVNIVDIHTQYTSIQNYGVVTIEWLTTVTYHWGVPLPIVTVNFKQDEDMFGKSIEGTPTTVYLNRKTADKNPFYFPPPMPGSLK